MSAVPSWLAAAAGQPALAGQANQFLGTHNVKYLYQGTAQASQTTAGTAAISSAGTYLAQTFTTAAAQTAIGYIAALISTTASQPTTTLQLSIYATSGGAPTGAPLITVTASPEYVSFAPAYVVFPVPLTVTPSTTYAIVTAPSGSTVNQDYTWARSNQPSGAYTSTNGTVWTSQAYGFLFQVFDQSAVGQLTATWEDSGARWTWSGYTATGLLSKLSEYTAAQGGGYLQSNRTFTYSNNILVGVA